jgi:predicted LPLAT superfamily acyltransferase
MSRKTPARFLVARAFSLRRPARHWLSRISREHCTAAKTVSPEHFLHRFASALATGRGALAAECHVIDNRRSVRASRIPRPIVAGDGSM